LKPWDIDKLHWGEILSYVHGAIREEASEYYLHRPQMGGKDSSRKWQKAVEEHLNGVWNICFPMTKNGRKEIVSQRKKEVPSKRKRLEEARKQLEQ